MNFYESHKVSTMKKCFGGRLFFPLLSLIRCPSQQKSRLLCGVLLLTTALAISLPILNTIIIYPAFTDIITSSIEEDAQRLATYTLPASLKHTTLTNETLDNQFFAAIYKLEHDFGILKIKVFSAKGEVIYSTEATDIGHLNAKSYFNDVVVKGIPYTKLVSKDMKTLEGQSISINVVETYAPLMSGNKFLGAFELYYDVTARKERMDQLVRYSTTGIVLLSTCLLLAVFILLHKEAARMAADDMTKNLREEVDRITQHDLKSPLTGILSGIEYLEQFTQLDEDQTSILNDMRVTANTGIKMINISLDLYKMEKCSYKFTPATVDLLAVSRRAAADLASISSTKGVDVLITRGGNVLRDGDTLPISTEETLCYSLITNLLKNALEASEPGQKVTLSLVENNAVVLTIHNPGTVPVDIRNNFFDKYTTSGKTTGTGLGTYSAKLMAETLGGSIAMTTSEENGTRIIVTLPKSPQPETA